jgi:hypothetical protein
MPSPSYVTEKLISACNCLLEEGPDLLARLAAAWQYAGRLNEDDFTDPEMGKEFQNLRELFRRAGRSFQNMDTATLEGFERRLIHLHEQSKKYDPYGPR